MPTLLTPNAVPASENTPKPERYETVTVGLGPRIFPGANSRQADQGRLASGGRAAFACLALRNGAPHLAIPHS